MSIRGKSKFFFFSFQESPRPLSGLIIYSRTHRTQKSCCIHDYSLLQKGLLQIKVSKGKSILRRDFSKNKRKLLVALSWFCMGSAQFSRHRCAAARVKCCRPGEPKFRVFIWSCNSKTAFNTKLF